MNRSERMDHIQGILEKMSDEQLENVRVYTVAELKEPNHEAVAMNAIISLSRKYGGVHTECRGITE